MNNHDVDTAVGVALAVALTVSVFLFGMVFEHYNQSSKLKKAGYVNVQINDANGIPIPGYIGCECRMSGRKDRKGIYFWVTQNMKGQFDEVQEGKAIPTDRGN